MLQTPPLLRRPIYTRVKYYNDSLVNQVVSFEVGRGGQVYFIHNDVRSLKGVVFRLKKIFPKYSINFIHGQESSDKIEDNTIEKIEKTSDSNIDDDIPF